MPGPRDKFEGKTFTERWLPNRQASDNRDAYSGIDGMWFDYRGAPGSKPQELVTMPPLVETENDAGGKVRYMYRSQDEDGNILRIAFINTGSQVDVHKMGGGGGIFVTALKTGLDASALPHCTTATDPDGNVFIFCCNGVDTPFKINVTTEAVSDIGLTSDRPDITQVTIARTAAGNIRGIVKYFISEVVSGVEGPLSEGAEFDTGEEADTIQLTFDHADLYNNDYRIYRTFADGVDPFLVDTVEVGATATTFNDSTHDDDLGGPPFIHGDPPPTGIVAMVSYFDRVYGITADKLYWSDLGQPESWYTAADGNFLRFGFGDGDSGKAISRAGDSLLLWSSNHLYQVFGRIPSEFTLREVLPSDGSSDSIGVLNHRAITHAPDGIYFFWNNRVYRLRGSNIAPISTPIDAIFANGTIASIKAALEFSAFYDRVFVTLTDGTGNLGLYVWDIPTQSWVGRNTNISYACTLSDTDGNGDHVLRFAGYDIDTASADHTIVYLEIDR